MFRMKKRSRVRTYASLLLRHLPAPFCAICLLLLLCLIPASSAKGAMMQKALAAPEDAAEFTEILLSDKAASLNGVYRMTKEMEAAVASGGGMQGLAKSLASLGTPGEIGPAYASELAGNPVFRVPVRFSEMPVDLMFVMQGDAIAGISTMPFSGEEETEEAAEKAFEEVDLALPVPSLQGELPGTLTIPEGEGPFPAVVLIHGSGPNDRDETLMSLKPFRDLAEGLAAQGAAVYRFDKRTYVYGAEIAGDHQFTLADESVEDAVAAVQLLAEQEKIDPDRIYVLGHSLGGTAIPAIDQALRKAPRQACGYILMAAAARPLDDLMREQYNFLYSLQPQITEELEAQRQEIFSQLDKLQDPDALAEDDLIAGAYAPYWKWLQAYDILGTAQKITVPCLLLQGEEDYQVTMEDFAMWQEAVGDKENWTLISCPGLTHPFVPGKKSDGSGAYMTSAKVDPQVIADISAFIQP